MSDTQGRLTVRTDYTWTVPNAKRLTKRSTVIRSPSFNDKRWQLELESKPNRFLNLWLKAIPTQLEASRGDWKRVVEYYMVVKTPCDQRLGQSSASKEIFSVESAVWGDNDIVEDSWCYNRDVLIKNSLQVEVHIVEHSSEGAMAVREDKLVTATKRVQALLSTFDDPDTSDIAFVFPSDQDQGKSMKVYASKKQLSRSSSYFREMFDPLPIFRLPSLQAQVAPAVPTDDMPEPTAEAEATSSNASTPAATILDDSEAPNVETLHETSPPTQEVPYPIDTPAYDSDNEIDDRYKVQYRPRPYRPHIKQMVVKDCKYATYRAILFWILSGLIDFAPLRSSERAKIFQNSTMDPGANYPSVRNLFKNTMDKDEYGLEWACPLPVSPKSVYRVAKAYGMKDLKDIALDHLMNSLTPQNVTFEIFSPFSARFTDIKEMQIDYLIQQWDRVYRTRGWMALFDPATLTTQEERATLHELISRTMTRSTPDYKRLLESEGSSEDTEDGEDVTQEEDSGED